MSSPFIVFFITIPIKNYYHTRRTFKDFNTLRTVTNEQYETIKTTTRGGVLITAILPLFALRRRRFSGK